MQVEEEIFIVRREHAASLMQLANQREQIDSLTLIVEELQKVVANLSPMTCQDRFFADLIFRGVRGSGHGLAVRPRGYVA